jgi:hypothetical protein
MADIFHLSPGEDPPLDQPFLLVRWRAEEGVSTDAHDHGVTDWVSSRLWNLAVARAPERARELGLSKIYICGPPHG